ncbi:MAG: hypothetical protein ACC657_15595 [Thiohalomonadales bacterium]
MSDFMFLDYIGLITIERPLFLIFALQPLILIIFSRMKMHALAKYADKHLWPWTINISEHYFKSRKILRFAAWLLLAIAMAGPQLPGLHKSFSEHNKNIKSDISIMLIADVNGITESEFNYYLIQLSDFIDNLNGEKIGFVALGPASALISPLTNDYDISYFYLKQMFDVVKINPNINTNNLYKSIKVSRREIQESAPSAGIIIYWSDYTRKKISAKNLIKTKILLEEIEGSNIRVIPIWNNSNELNISSDDIIEIFGDLADDYSGMTLNNLYNDHLSNIKSLAIFDANKDYGFQQLYAYPLILGLLLLLLSFIPFQLFQKVTNEN